LAEREPSLTGFDSKGLGVEKNFESGVEIYDEMCTKGVALGCFNVGISYANWSADDNRDNFGFIDHNKAIDYFIQACDLGDTKGCNEAADFLDKSNSSDQEILEAKRLRKRAKKLPKGPQKLQTEGPTFKSRINYVACRLGVGNVGKFKCHPHLNVPQYVI